jgi:uncharacterized protein involved in exopolysaccharide biosynthesis
MSSDSMENDRELREQLDGASAFLRRAWRFWRSVPLVLALGAIACAVFLYVRKPEYRSETVVLYSQPAAAPGEALDASGSARNVTVRLKELLMSRPKLERVVGEYGLYPSVRRDLGMSEAVEELKKHIEYRAPGGDTFSIAFTGHSPNEAQGVTKRLAALVIDQDAELRRNQARVTRDFLVAEKGKTEAALRSAERELAAFMAKHPRFALDTTPLATGAAIRATSAPLAGAASAQQRPRSLVILPNPTVSRGGANGSAAGARAPAGTAVDADSELARANAALAAARANLAEQLERYTPAHPDVRAAAAAVERAEGRLASLASAPRTMPAPAPAPPASDSAPTEPKPIVVAPRPAGPAPAPAPAPAAASNSSRDVVALETEWLKLTRAVTEARQRQDQVEAALFKADIAASSESGGRGIQMTVIDPAYLPSRPQPPGRGLIVALFVAVSLVFGVIAALVRAVLDDRIFEARDARGPAELLAEIPRPGNYRRAHVPG